MEYKVRGQCALTCSHPSAPLFLGLVLTVVIATTNEKMIFPDLVHHMWALHYAKALAVTRQGAAGM